MFKTIKVKPVGSDIHVTDCSVMHKPKFLPLKMFNLGVAPMFSKMILDQDKAMQNIRDK